MSNVWMSNKIVNECDLYMQSHRTKQWNENSFKSSSSWENWRDIEYFISFLCCYTNNLEKWIIAVGITVPLNGLFCYCHWISQMFFLFFVLYEPHPIAGKNQEDYAKRRRGRKSCPGCSDHNLYPFQNVWNSSLSILDAIFCWCFGLSFLGYVYSKITVDCLRHLSNCFVFPNFLGNRQTFNEMFWIQFSFFSIAISIVFLNWLTPRTLELFVQSMLTKTLRITNARNAKTLSPSHMKQCIMSESRFDFLRELVKNIPDINVAEEQLAADPIPDDVSSPTHSSSELPTTTNALPVGQNGRSRVGAKRSVDHSGSDSESASMYSTWKFTKQHSLDSIAERLSKSATSTSASSTTSTGAVPVINFSIKFDAGDNGTPKLQRIDSAPLPVTSITSSDTPIINFDFTKVSFAAASTSTSSKTAPSTPINHSVETILQKPSRKTSTVTEVMRNDWLNFTTSKIFQCNLNFSHLQPHLSALQQQQQPKQSIAKHLPSNASKSNYASISSLATSASKSATPSPPTSASMQQQQQPPVINMSTNHTSMAPVVSYNMPSSTISNSNSLEMDEDYDNIWLNWIQLNLIDEFTYKQREKEIHIHINVYTFAKQKQILKYTNNVKTTHKQWNIHSSGKHETISP